MNNFKKASKENLLFVWAGASFSLSDLWHLRLQPAADHARHPQPNLDEIAISVAEKIEALGARGSFVKTTDANKSRALEREELRLEILKEVIADRLAEAAARAEADTNAERIKQLTAALAAKKADAVGNMSEDELQAELKKLRSAEAAEGDAE